MYYFCRSTANWLWFTQAWFLCQLYPQQCHFGAFGGYWNYSDSQPIALSIGFLQFLMATALGRSNSYCVYHSRCWCGTDWLIQLIADLDVGLQPTEKIQYSFRIDGCRFGRRNQLSVSRYSISLGSEYVKFNPITQHLAGT